jgi:hypothetical protein
MPHRAVLAVRIGTLYVCRLRVGRIGSILVVDDERLAREMVVEILRERGLTRSAGSVDEALKRSGRSFAAIPERHPDAGEERIPRSGRAAIGCAIPVVPRPRSAPRRPRRRRSAGAF